MTGGPWTFDEAVAQDRAAADRQEAAEAAVLDAYRDHARREQLYDVALATKMWELKRSGVAITACERLAKGDERVATLRRERNEAEGRKEVAKRASWRVTADRRTTEELITWSMRRELAEFRGQTPAAPEDGTVFGGREAA